MVSDKSDRSPLWLFMPKHEPSIEIMVEQAREFLAAAAQNVHLRALPSEALLPMIETWYVKLDAGALNTLGDSQF